MHGLGSGVICWHVVDLFRMHLHRNKSFCIQSKQFCLFLPTRSCFSLLISSSLFISSSFTYEKELQWTVVSCRSAIVFDAVQVGEMLSITSYASQFGQIAYATCLSQLRFYDFKTVTTNDTLCILSLKKTDHIFMFLSFSFYSFLCCPFRFLLICPTLANIC